MVVITEGGSFRELRELKLHEYDFEIGDEENSFEITILRDEWEEIEENAQAYIPGTECGGLVRRKGTDTKQDVVAIGGYTWRGMLQRAILEPPPGSDYLTYSGDISEIINLIVSEQFYPILAGPLEPTGVTVSNYRFDRYVTVYDGLKKMLESVGRKLVFERSYDYEGLENGLMVVTSAPIVDYSEKIEFSSDWRINYSMQKQTDGVNHLICLGSGELKNRQVIHLYMSKDGRVINYADYEGYETITDVYDYAGATLTELRQGGIERLKELANKNVFAVSIDEGMDVDVGDIVGGRDYLSGMKMSAPVIGKVYKWRNGIESIEYKFGDAKGE